MLYSLSRFGIVSLLLIHINALHALPSNVLAALNTLANETQYNQIIDYVESQWRQKHYSEISDIDQHAQNQLRALIAVRDNHLRNHYIKYAAFAGLEAIALIAFLRKNPWAIFIYPYLLLAVPAIALPTAFAEVGALYDFNYWWKNGDATIAWITKLRTAIAPLLLMADVQENF